MKQLIIITALSLSFSCVEKSTNKKKKKKNNQEKESRSFQVRKTSFSKAEISEKKHDPAVPSYTHNNANELIPGMSRKKINIKSKSSMFTSPLSISTAKSMDMERTIGTNEFDLSESRVFKTNESIFIKIRNTNLENLSGCIEYLSENDFQSGKKFSACNNTASFKKISNYSSLATERWVYNDNKKEYMTSIGFRSTIPGKYRLVVTSIDGRKSEIIISSKLQLNVEIPENHKNGELVSQTKWINKNDIIYLVKYYSQNNILSTTIVVPNKKNPIDGFPLFVWAHGTVGLAAKCIPSKTGYAFPTIKKDRSYITIIPDYDMNPHEYYTSEHAARSIYDAMRALKSIKGLHVNFNKMIISGNSQGGHVLLKTLEINKVYAPEFYFKKAIAFSPGSDSLGHLQNMANYYVKNNGHPFISLVATMFYAVAKSEKSLETYDAMFKKGQSYRYIADTCVSDFFKDKEYTFDFSEDFKSRAIKNNWKGTLWKKWFDKRIAGLFYTKTPIIIVNGLDDNLTGPIEANNLVKRLKVRGNKVTHYPLKNLGHHVMTEPVINELYKLMNKDFQ